MHGNKKTKHFERTKRTQCKKIGKIRYIIIKETKKAEKIIF